MTRTTTILHLDDQPHTVDWLPSRLFMTQDTEGKGQLVRRSLFEWHAVIGGSLAWRYIITPSIEEFNCQVRQGDNIIIIDYMIDSAEVNPKLLAETRGAPVVLWTAYPEMASAAFGGSVPAFQKGQRTALIEWLLGKLRGVVSND